MAEERDDDEQFNQTEGKAGQQPTDQQRQPGELQTPETTSGDGNLGGQSSSGDAETDSDTLQTDRTTNSEGSGGSSGSAGEGFIGSQSGGSDFAEQGQGATEDDSNIETGQSSRSQDNDAGGSSGAE